VASIDLEPDPANAAACELDEALPDKRRAEAAPALALANDDVLQPAARPPERAPCEHAVALREPPRCRVELDVAGHGSHPVLVRQRHIGGVLPTMPLVARGVPPRRLRRHERQRRHPRAPLMLLQPPL